MPATTAELIMSNTYGLLQNILLNAYGVLKWPTEHLASLLGIGGLLLISAFASSSETAFFSLNRFQLRRIRDQYHGAYDRIRTLLGRPSRLLVLILLINEMVNIAISSLVAGVFQRGSTQHWYITAFISIAVAMPLVLFFGEITPKVVAAKMNRVVAVVNSKVLILLYRFMYPLLHVIDSAISSVLRGLKAEGRDHLSRTTSVLSEDDFVTLMEEGHREGTVDPDERKLIKNVLEFDDGLVSEVMTPITQTFCVSSSARISEVLPEIRAQKYSRIPVFQKSKKKIIGVLYVKDLLNIHNHPNLKEIEVKSLTSQPMFVSPNTRLSTLFRRFKSSKTHIAICVGPNEEAIGIVTMEDVLESIFGEISDERDVR